jgi:hypothetical protein
MVFMDNCWCRDSVKLFGASDILAGDDRQGKIQKETKRKT